MFLLYANKTTISILQREPLTSGSANIYQIRFEFSDDWKGLSRTVIFRSGKFSAAVPLGESFQCDLPSEAIACRGQRLEVGIVGRDDSQKVILSTVWANLGYILEGAAAGSDCPASPSEPGDPPESGNPPGNGNSSESGMAWGIGHGLALKNGDLTVVTTDDFKGDNTLPMTAAGVETITGNIEALLGTI